MWIYTKDGFYSVVKDRNDESLLIVRSRVRKHLVRFIEAHNFVHNASIGDKVIVKTPNRDYPFRVVFHWHSVSLVVAHLIRSIDYGNYKAASHVDHNVLLNVWKTTRELTGIEEKEKRDKKLDEIIASRKSVGKKV